MFEDAAAGSSPEGETTDVELVSAVKAATISGNVLDYREARRAERVGKPLAAQPAAPAAAKPDDQAASTDASPKPASEAGKPKGEKLKARLVELDAENAALSERLRTRKALREELAGYELTPKPGAKDPASPAAGTLAETVQRPDTRQPMLTSADFFQKHPEADLGDYSLYVTRYDRATEAVESRQREQKAKQFEALTKRHDSFAERLKTASTADPKFWESVTPEITALKTVAMARSEGLDVFVDNFIADELMDSKVGPQLMLHLSANPEDLKTLREAEDPDDLKRRVGRLEGRLGTAKEPDPPLKPKKVVSDAPLPGTTLGRKPAASTDGLVSAVNGDNFSAFRAEKQARALAARGGR